MAGHLLLIQRDGRQEDKFQEIPGKIRGDQEVVGVDYMLY